MKKAAQFRGLHGTIQQPRCRIYLGVGVVVAGLAAGFGVVAPAGVPAAGRVGAGTPDFAL